jgi:hypothetical protein
VCAACGGEAASRMRRRGRLAHAAESLAGAGMCVQDVCGRRVRVACCTCRCAYTSCRCACRCASLAPTPTRRAHTSYMRQPILVQTPRAHTSYMRQSRAEARHAGFALYTRPSLLLRLVHLYTPDLPCTRGLHYSCALYTCTRRICLVHEAAWPDTEGASE